MCIRDRVNANSKLVKKYAEEIDRDSAYEMLNKKIETASVAAEEEVVVKKKSNEPSTTEMIGKSVTKVVTSATFIRGAFSILMKMMKK